MYNMYKSVNINGGTYQQLQILATQLHKPKAQIVDVLVKEYYKIMQKQGKTKLEKFNQEMGAKVKALKFSKKIKVDTSSIDADFSALANTDY